MLDCCPEVRGVLPKIIVFAKAPVPGRVKTRLCSLLDPASAAELHSAFVRDTVTSLLQISGVADIELCCDAKTSLWDDIKVPQSMQGPGDLGERLHRVLSRTLNSGCPSATVVGADSPGLPVAYVEKFLYGGTDAALGPTTDGGYYAIRSRRAVPGMFSGVRWSTSATLDDTMLALRRCGLSVALGDPWFDVDEPLDLLRLLELKNLPRHTARWLAANRDLLSSSDLSKY